MSAFVDTSALYAILDRDDANHERARVTWENILEGGGRLVTSNYVVVETSALVQHRLGLAGLRSFTDDIVPVLDVEWVSREEHAAATSALLLAGRRGLSLVDCTSFEIMRRLGLRHAFAFDEDFVERGFEVM